jgi:hypothetical protein
MGNAEVYLRAGRAALSVSVSTVVQMPRHYGNLFQETFRQAARLSCMSSRKPHPMIIQPPANGSHTAQQMVSRVGRVGPQQPPPYDKALCAKSRAQALKLQREALERSVPKADPAQSSHQKTS